MTQTEYLILAIIILVVLAITFIVSFALYKRTPKPKGCEDLEISEEKCAACNNETCALRQEKEEK